MIVSTFIMLFIIILFFMLNYRNSFTKIISLYFVTIALMTIIVIIYISRFSNYYPLVRIDYKIYMFLSSISLPLSTVSRMYILSMALYMFDAVIFMNCLRKLGIVKFALYILPCVYFAVLNDPAVSKYLLLTAAVEGGGVTAFISVSHFINRIFLYSYMIMPFFGLGFYCRRTKIFVKSKDAIISGICLLAVNMFVFFVFIHGIYSIIMFDRVNIARLPSEYGVINNLWMPLLLFAIMIFVITLTLLFRPFQIFDRFGRNDTNSHARHSNKNMNMIFHMYKNAFLGIQQQFNLAENNINSRKYDSAISNIHSGKKIAADHMQMLNKILGSISNVKTNLRVINLKECVNDAVEKLKMSDNTPVNINFFSDSESINIIGDRQQLTEVFLNLLINSAEALKEKGADDAHIDITLICEDGLVLITVYDNGTGIQRKNLRRIFQLFFSTKSGGNGIGLNYVSNIIKLHHGEINIKSVYGQYACFQIVLPIYTPTGRKNEHNKNCTV